jgi:uncharacterized protein
MEGAMATNPMTAKELYDRALLAAKEGNTDSARVLGDLKASAELGFPDAHYALATWYLHGFGVKQNLETAIEHLEIAAEQDHSSALFDLAVCYERGIGKTKNLSATIELYMRAALWGDISAYFEVGRCFYYGIGIIRNERLADLWFEKAEQLGIRYEMDEARVVEFKSR